MLDRILDVLLELTEVVTIIALTLTGAPPPIVEAGAVHLQAL
jgi:hypothetical protein